MTHLRAMLITAACAVLGLAGCGGGGNGNNVAPSYTTQISSDPAFDGDIEQTSASSFTVTQGMSATVQSVLSGIDPVALTEFRAFLDFPLGGPGGVPSDAIIDSAFLEVFINDIQPTGSSIPIRVELVSFQPPTLIPSDFDRAVQPPLAFTTIVPPLSPADAGAYVPIDVTSLMVQAQRLGLSNFQVRILEDLGVSVPVLVEINDSTGADRASHAPLLTVTYL